MIKPANVRVRIDPHVKEEAEALLDELGLTPTVAITMFYKQIIHQQRIPFAIIADARGRRGLPEGADELAATVPGRG